MKEKRKPLDKIKVGRIWYAIYHNCSALIEEGSYVMRNNFTGSLMTWENGKQRIPIR
jgi:hypothetical protein